MGPQIKKSMITNDCFIEGPYLFGYVDLAMFSICWLDGTGINEAPKGKWYK